MVRDHEATGSNPVAPTKIAIMAQCWVYVLQSERHNKFYIGITSSLFRRIKEHNSGVNRSTSSGVPWKLILREQYPNHLLARKREIYFKSGPGRKWLNENIISHRPDASG